MHKDMKLKTCVWPTKRSHTPRLLRLGIRTPMSHSQLSTPSMRRASFIRQLEKERSLAKIRQEYEARLNSEVRPCLLHPSLKLTVRAVPCVLSPASSAPACFAVSCGGPRACYASEMETQRPIVTF